MTAIERYRQHALPVLLGWLATLPSGEWIGTKRELAAALIGYASASRQTFATVPSGVGLPMWLSSISPDLLAGGFVVGFAANTSPPRIRFAKVAT